MAHFETSNNDSTRIQLLKKGRELKKGLKYQLSKIELQTVKLGWGLHLYKFLL